MYIKHSWVYRQIKKAIPSRVKGFIKSFLKSKNVSIGAGMEPIKASISLQSKFRFVNTTGVRMSFSPFRLFTFTDSPEEVQCLKLIGEFLSSKHPLALYGKGKFLEYLLKYSPALKFSVKCIIADKPEEDFFEGIPVITPDRLPVDIKTVFLCETLAAKRWRMRKKMREGVNLISAEILTEIAMEHIPGWAWVPEYSTIYPIDIPEICIEPGLDMVLVDSPSRNMALMPNGLAYVHNALKRSGIKFQTVDLDIIAYHRYHVHRFFDGPEGIYTPAGNRLPDDPWLAENYELWQKDDTIEYFRPLIEETIQALAEAKPKIIGFSIQACNIKFAKAVAQGVKKLLPDTLILVGGYSCYQPAIGRLAFQESDYMIIGEGDLNIGDLVKSLLKGDRPIGLPGIMSRLDPLDQPFKTGPMPHDLNALDMPKYEWYGINLYRNYNHYQLTPIIASRGCRWSKCKFCAERFAWRIRRPENVVDEFEFLAGQGCDLFMFNESDLNGMPDALLKICDEIIRRKLTIKLTGQLRIHKNSDKPFFDKLKAAGFVSLRFGVDAWSENTLRLQTKGYTLEMIPQNLKDCHESGIYTEVNIVLGIPGETDDDITKSIDLITECKPYIGRVANINPLMLFSGSVYWENPEDHNIKFKGDKKEILKKHQHMVPDDIWFSEEPYIDQHVRKKRFERVVVELHERGFDTGPFAKQVIKDVLDGKGAGRSARPDAEEADSGGRGADVVVRPSFKDSFDKNLMIFKYNGSFYGVDRESSPETKDIVSSNTKITSIHRENPSDIRLITEGFHSYNIIKAEGIFYAIKQGYPFDINLAEKDGYDRGVCFNGSTLKEVEASVSNFIKA